jgi:hypothetical protein
MADDFDLEGFEQDLKKQLEQSNIAFQGIYKSELNELTGLSRDEIDSITPDTTDLQKYDELITVVKAASAVNLAQAELKNQIEKLGTLAVEIAKHVPSLAALFV